MRQHLILWISQRRRQEPVTSKKNYKQTWDPAKEFSAQKGQEAETGALKWKVRRSSVTLLCLNLTQPSTIPTSAIRPRDSDSVPTLPQSPSIRGISLSLQKWLSWFLMGELNHSGGASSTAPHFQTDNITNKRKKGLKMHPTLHNANS